GGSMDGCKTSRVNCVTIPGGRWTGVRGGRSWSCDRPSASSRVGERRQALGSSGAGDGSLLPWWHVFDGVTQIPAQWAGRASGRAVMQAQLAIMGACLGWVRYLGERQAARGEAGEGAGR